MALTGGKLSTFLTTPSASILNWTVVLLSSTILYVISLSTPSLSTASNRIRDVETGAVERTVVVYSLWENSGGKSLMSVRRIRTVVEPVRRGSP